MVSKPCLDCGEPSPSTRCPVCTSAHEALRPSRRIRGRYDNNWVKLRAIAIKRHPWCEQCRATDDLTGDHRVPLSRGGRSVMSNIAVLCRACNSAKRDRVGASHL